MLAEHFRNLFFIDVDVYRIVFLHAYHAGLGTWDLLEILYQRVVYRY